MHRVLMSVLLAPDFSMRLLPVLSLLRQANTKRWWWWVAIKCQASSIIPTDLPVSYSVMVLELFFLKPIQKVTVSLTAF